MSVEARLVVPIFLADLAVVGACKTFEGSLAHRAVFDAGGQHGFGTEGDQPLMANMAVRTNKSNFFMLIDGVFM